MAHGCDIYREAISARADGEEAPVRRTDLDAHLLTCGACSAFAATVVDLARHVEVHRSTRPAPDLTTELLLAIDLPDASRRHGQLRLLLVLVGAVQLLLGSVTLLGTTPVDAHLMRDIGAWQVALAGGLLYAAWRPRASTGLLPVVGLVAVVGAAGAVADVVSGTATVLAELTHVSPLVAAWPLWKLQDASPAGGLDPVVQP